MTDADAGSTTQSETSAKPWYKQLPTRRRMVGWLALIVLLFVVVPGCWLGSFPERNDARPHSEYLKDPVRKDEMAWPARTSNEPLGALLGLDLIERATELEVSVRVLADDIGSRLPGPGGGLDNAAAWIIEQWQSQGYSVSRQTYPLGSEEGATQVANLEVVLGGGDPSLPEVIIGAHYDTCGRQPGADDNASGIALLLALTKDLEGIRFERTVRFVAFACEEPEYFQTELMGSWQYASILKQMGVEVEAMISLDALGYYSDEDDSQTYPPVLGAFFPSRGNFVGVVGNLPSTSLVKKVGKLLIDHSRLPVQSAALPNALPGVSWSDHWSFWKHGFPGVLLTDTGPFRNAGYHQASDTPDTLNYLVMAELSRALPRVVRGLARGEP